MAAAFEKYESYIQYLAEGKLDGFLDSLKPEDNHLPDGLNGIRDRHGPFLLVHGLGQTCDTERIEELFCRSIVFVAVGLARMGLLTLIFFPQTFIRLFRLWENSSYA
jgi:hypothetical protein